MNVKELIFESTNLLREGTYNREGLLPKILKGQKDE